MNALPDVLEDDLLYFFTFGPRTGETILLRIPPHDWVIIDSFKCDTQAAADIVVGKYVRKYGGQVVCIVLTHPHQDHHQGMLELLDNHRAALVGCMHPTVHAPSRLSSDSYDALGQSAKRVYDRITRAWEDNPARKWATFRAECRRAGEALITSLHPSVPLDPTRFAKRPNDISSAMLVEWHDLRLLLGADVPRPRWTEIGKAFPNLGRHAAMKIPHHGSTEAIHQVYAKGTSTRLWVVTPFEKGGLPSAEDGHGLDRLLQYVSTVHLTSLPFKHSHEHQAPCIATRKQIRVGSRPQRQPRNPAPITLGDLNRHVIVAFNRLGHIQEVRHGPGSVSVNC